MKSTVYILLVEDEPRMRDSLAALLRLAGYGVKTAPDGREACNCIAGGRFDLALVDLRLPDTDGFQVARRLTSAHRDLPIILITGDPEADTEARARQSGVLDLLIKPFDPDRLLARIKEAAGDPAPEIAPVLPENLPDACIRGEDKPEASLTLEREKRRDLERRLDEAETRYAALVEHSPDFIYVLDPDGRFRFAGGALEELLGFQPEDLVGEHFSILLPEPDLEKARWRFNERRTGERSTRHFETRLFPKAGLARRFDVKALSVELNAFGIYDEADSDGERRFVGTLGVARDLRKTKEMEAGLARSRQEYRDVVESINDVLFTLDPDWMIREVSPSARSLFGLNPSELKGRAFLDRVHPEDRRRVVEHFHGVRQGKNESGEFRVRYADQGECWVKSATKPRFTGEQFAGLKMVLTDISRAKSLEYRLHGADRMAFTGMLASKLAHEINSPLQALMVLLNQDKNDAQAPGRTDERRELIEQALSRIAKTVRNLRGLSRIPGGTALHMDVNRTVEETTDLIQFHLKRRRIRLECELAPGLPPALAAPDHLSRILLNLINNAMEAMAMVQPPPENGFIRIRTGMSEDRILLSLRDSGPGFPEEHLSDVLEAFYTCKEGAALGMGLSIARDLIQSTGGNIDARNHPEGGAEVLLTLPRAPRSVPAIGPVKGVADAAG